VSRVIISPRCKRIFTVKVESGAQAVTEVRPKGVVVKHKCQGFSFYGINICGTSSRRVALELVGRRVN